MANSISNAVAPPSTSEGVAKMPSENGIGSNSSAARIEHSDMYTLPTTKQLELQTRYFPYFEEESVLWCSRECDALKYVTALSYHKFLKFINTIIGRYCNK